MAFVGPYQVYKIDGDVTVARVVDWDKLATSVNNASAAAEGNAKTHADTKDTSNRAAWAAADTAKLAEAKAYTDAQVAPDRGRLAAIEAKNTTQDGRLSRVEAVAPKVSNMALDEDGVPYFSPGATGVHIIQAADGTAPYFVTFMTASLDADGVPYFA